MPVTGFLSMTVAIGSLGLQDLEVV